MQDNHPTTVVSVVSHGQGPLVERLLCDIERHWDTSRLSLVLTLNVPETLGFDTGDFSFPILVVRNRRPKGFGANHNAAFGCSCGELFCVLNPDIRCADDPLPALRSALLAQGHIGLVAPAIVNPDGVLEDSARRCLTPGRLLRRHLRRERACDYAIESEPLEPDWVAGMFMLVRSPVFAQVGGFDERYFMYCEDADLCRRLWQQGIGVTLVPASRVVHEGQRASRSDLRHLAWHVSSLLRFFLTARRPAHAR